MKKHRFTIPKTGVYLMTVQKGDVILSETIEVRKIPKMQKLEVENEFIEKKARDLLNSLFIPSRNTHCYLLPIIAKFIRELVEEIRGK